MSGPRFVLRIRLASLKDRSIVQYRRAASKFIDFLSREQLVPESLEEWDDLIVEYYFQERLTPSALRLTIARR